VAKKPAVDPTAAQEAVDDAQTTLIAANTALDDDDAEEFAKLIEDLQKALKTAEDEIKWVKQEAAKNGEAITPMNSTLASLSSEVTDIKQQLRELSEKLLTMTQPSPSTATDQSSGSIQQPPKETPAIAAAGTSIPKVVGETLPVEQPAEVKPVPPENANIPSAVRKRFRLL
jgi:predicted ribosome quality control (RQC) complex YloA/Tae2 family protein